MKLERLEITALPGVAGAFALDGISSGSNLITGPNGIGKSSLIRALKYLVGEVRSDDPKNLMLKAVFEGSDGQWTVQRTGSEVSWEKDGQLIERPRFPDRDQLNYYWLSMEDLLVADEKEEHLASELRRELNGGYDIAALRKNAPGTHPGKKAQREVVEAEKDARDVQVGYEALHKDEGEVPILESRITDARKAQADADNLEKALGLLEAQSNRQKIEAGLREFPKGMEQLLGNELQEFAVLDQKHEKSKTDKADQQLLFDDAQKRLKETGLEEARPEGIDLSSQGNKLAEAGAITTLLKEKCHQRDQAKLKMAAAIDALGGDAESFPDLAPNSVAAAEDLARELQKNQARKLELESQLRGLSAGTLSSSGSARGPMLLAGAGGLLTLAAALFIQDWRVAIAGLLAVAGGGWSLYRELQQRGSREGESTAARGELTEVVGHLEILEQQRASMAKQRGFDPGLTASGLDRFVRLVQQYETDKDKYEDSEATIQELKRDLETGLGQVRNFLEKWCDGVGEESALEAMKDLLADLRRRTVAAEDACGVAKAAMKDLGRLEIELKDLGNEMDSLFENVGLQPGQRQELLLRLNEFDAWKEANAKLLPAKAVEAERKSSIENLPELLSRVNDGDEFALQTEQKAAEDKAGRLEKWQEERTEIGTRLEDAGRHYPLEESRARVVFARSELEGKYREALHAEAEGFLLDGVQAEHRNEHEPAVLTDARERFLRFTHNTFRLELDEERGFVARDLKQEATRSILELSSATRMQLLLAVRMAWAGHIEKGREAVPIFLDEALTTSDVDRFSSVANSLEQLAQDEQRQFFYLSARPQEVALWEQLTGHRPNHINMLDVRSGESELSSEGYVLPPREMLPSPNGNTPEEYAAELGVPAVDPLLPEGSLHLFHLLRDNLDLLYYLMDKWSSRSLGQLESLLSSGNAAAVFPEEAHLGGLQARCLIARCWFGLWRQGRGKKVDRVALEFSGLVSPAFIEAASQLAESLDGDGAQLLDALPGLPRYRRQKVTDLKDWLEEEGYIDPADVLSRQERERRVLVAAAGQAEPGEVRLVVQWLEAGWREE